MGQSNLNISPGFNLIAGARYALSPQWAFFGCALKFKIIQARIREPISHPEIGRQTFENAPGLAIPPYPPTYHSACANW